MRLMIYKTISLCTCIVRRLVKSYALNRIRPCLSVFMYNRLQIIRFDKFIKKKNWENMISVIKTPNDERCSRIIWRFHILHTKMMILLQILCIFFYLPTIPNFKLLNCGFIFVYYFYVNWFIQTEKKLKNNSFKDKFCLW
jgi:hypothetical protein